jgi:predicted nucleotidyltransferase
MKIIIANAIVGSVLYRLNDKNSDVDRFVIEASAPEWFVGSKSGAGITSHKLPEGDMVVAELSKFVDMIGRGTPNAIDALYSDMLSLSSLYFGELRGMDRFLLSKQVYPKYKGYARKELLQIQKHFAAGCSIMTQDALSKSKARAMRVAMHGTRLLNDGCLIPYITQEEIDICRGMASVETSEAIRLIEMELAELDKAMENTKLSEFPSLDAVDSWLADVYMSIWNRMLAK